MTSPDSKPFFLSAIKTCNTAPCKKLAAKMLHMMDHGPTRPCDVRISYSGFYFDFFSSLALTFHWSFAVQLNNVFYYLAKTMSHHFFFKYMLLSAQQRNISVYHFLSLYTAFSSNSLLYHCRWVILSLHLLSCPHWFHQLHSDITYKPMCLTTAILTQPNITYLKIYINLHTR